MVLLFMPYEDNDGSVLLLAVLEKAEDSDLRYSKCPGGQVISSTDIRAQLFKALLA